LVLWHVVAGAHNDGLMVGLVLAGMELALSGLTAPPRLVAGLALLTVAANIKIVAAAAICCVGAELARGHTVRRGAAMLLGVLAAGAALSVAIAAVTGLGLGWVGTLGDSAQVHSWLAPTNQLGFLIGAQAIPVTVTVGAVLGLCVGAGLMWTIYRGRLDPLTGLGFVFATMLLTGPVVQPWYLLWVVPVLAASRRPDRALVIVSAVFAMVLPPVGGGVAVLVAGYLGAAALLALGLGFALYEGKTSSRYAHLLTVGSRSPTGALSNSAGRGHDGNSALPRRRGRGRPR
jgi:alpha-1,6-mannosyltransferase